MGRRDSRRRGGAMTTKIRQVIPLARTPPDARICAAMPTALPLLLVSGVLAVAALPTVAVAQGDAWLSEGRCRLATDSLPAAYARCGTLAVPLDPTAPDGPKVEVFVARLGPSAPSRGSTPCS